MKILVLANALLNKEIASGGDILSQELIKRVDIPQNNLIFMVPEISEEYFRKTFPESRVVSLPASFMDNESVFSKYIFMIFPIYIIRSFKACLLIHNIQTDIIITTGDFFCNTVPAFYKKWKHKKNKWIAHLYHINPSPWVRKGNSFLMSIVSYFMQRFSFILIKKKADRVILLNREVQMQLEKFGFDSSKLFVMGGGIDYKRIQTISSSKTEQYDACFLGRINQTKGVYDLPAIWKHVVSSDKNAKLLIMGFGTEYGISELNRLFESYSVKNNVTIKGYISSEEVYSLIKSCKIFISPSYEEGWGIAVCEGMACGLPVVAYDLSAYREYFGSTTRLVNIGDKEKFAESIIELLNNSEERDNLGNVAKDIASKYDWNIVAQRYIEQIRLA